MTDAHDIARATAKRLAPQLGKDLPLTVEKVIHGAVKPGQFVDLTIIPVAAFIVQCAQFIYTMHKDSLGKENLDTDALKRKLRLELGLPEHVTPKVRDAVINAVIDEVKDED